MQRNTDLADSVQKAMEAKQLSRDQLAEALGTNRLMIEKLLCGEIVPSTHLEKQLEEVLEIPPATFVQSAGSHDRQRKIA